MKGSTAVEKLKSRKPFTDEKSFLGTYDPVQPRKGSMFVRLQGKFIFIALLLLWIALFAVQNRIDQLSGKMSRAKSLSVLPKGELLKTVSLGYSSVIADLLWLEVVQAMGERDPTEDGYRWIYHATDVVTTLDPKFEYSYQISGIALAAMGKQVELSNQILLKGVKNSPDDWRIPYYLGYNYFFYFNDFQTAGDYIGRAALLPGHPDYLAGFAARLYLEARDPDLALEFLRNAYQDAREENVKNNIEIKMKEVTVERDIYLLNREIDEYEKRYKKTLSSLSDLLSSGIAGQIPEEPFGGFYFYDAKMNWAQSSTHPDRMRIYRRR